MDQKQTQHPFDRWCGKHASTHVQIRIQQKQMTKTTQMRIQCLSVDRISVLVLLYMIFVFRPRMNRTKRTFTQGNTNNQCSIFVFVKSNVLAITLTTISPSCQWQTIGKHLIPRYVTNDRETEFANSDRNSSRYDGQWRHATQNTQQMQIRRALWP